MDMGGVCAGRGAVGFCGKTANDAGGVGDPADIGFVCSEEGDRAKLCGLSKVVGAVGVSTPGDVGVGCSVAGGRAKLCGASMVVGVVGVGTPGDVGLVWSDVGDRAKLCGASNVVGAVGGSTGEVGDCGIVGSLGCLCVPHGAGARNSIGVLIIESRTPVCCC